MATMTPAVISRAGVTEANFAPNAGGDAMPVGPTNFLRIANTSSGSINVSMLYAPGATGIIGMSYFGATALVLGFGAGVTRLVGPLDPDLFADPTTGMCTITYSSVVSLVLVPLTIDVRR